MAFVRSYAKHCLTACYKCVIGYAVSCTFKTLGCQWRCNCSVPDVRVMCAQGI